MTQPTTVDAIAEHLGGTVVRGDGSKQLSRVMPLGEAESDALSFINHTKYLSELDETRAGAVLMDAKLIDRAPPHLTVIQVEHAYVAYARAAQVLSTPPPRPSGIHPTVAIDETAEIGEGCRMGPFVVVGAGAKVGARTVLHAGVHLEAGSRVGSDSELKSHVVISHGCEVGSRCLIHPGVVIGADGFGFAQRVESGRLIEHVKIPQTGRVVIEDDVEIGANCCVDRAALGTTRVGAGTKIDNLVQLGHNVQVGPRCILVAQSGVAGSSKLGEEVILGAQAGISGHLEVGARSLAYGQAGVTENVAPGSKVGGTPALPAHEWMKNHVRIKRLGSLFERVKRLERAIFGSEET